MKMTFWNRVSIVTLTGMGITGLAAYLPVSGQATPSAESREASPVEEVEATVLKLVRNDRDDVDGFSLEGGKEVHFPPHVWSELEPFVKVGEKVKVKGRNEVRPRGETVFVATQISSGSQSVEIQPPPPPHRRDQEQDKPMQVQGKVRQFAKNPHGDVDGLLLEDGTEVKLPPHQSKELTALVKKGDEVKVEGNRHVTPHGDVHLHAMTITAVESGKSLQRDKDHGPPPPHHGGPKGGPRRHEQGAPPHEARVQEDILRELKAIHQLLEKQTAR